MLYDWLNTTDNDKTGEKKEDEGIVIRQLLYFQTNNLQPTTGIDRMIHPTIYIIDIASYSGYILETLLP